MLRIAGLASQGMTYFLCVFHEQATHTHNCDTVSKSGNDRIYDSFLPRSRASRNSLIKMQDSKIQKSKIRNLQSLICNSRRGGFTLLEVLVAIAILGIAVTVVLQLFSANLRAISASGDYVSALTKAEAKMREILSDDKLSDKSLSETTDDGYRIDVSITDALKDRTENLQVRLLEINLTVRWTRGTKDKSITFWTMKVVEKEI